MTSGIPFYIMDRSLALGRLFTGVNWPYPVEFVGSRLVSIPMQFEE